MSHDRTTMWMKLHDLGDKKLSAPAPVGKVITYWSQNLPRLFYSTFTEVTY